MKKIKLPVTLILVGLAVLVIAKFWGLNTKYYYKTPAEVLISKAEKLNPSPQAVFHKVWRIIKNDYLDNTHNHQEWVRWNKRYKDLIETEADAEVCIDSMIASLNDPYTRYLPREEFQEQTRNIDSKLQGIGVHITEKDGRIIIISVIEDTPAQKYGLKKRDEIIKVGPVSIKGKSLSEVADMIRGKKGTDVILTVLRNKEALVKSITREEIKIKTVKSEILENNIAYIKILSFISSDTTNEVKKAISAANDAKGIIVDVRGNYGGLLANAIYISNLFLKKGNIVSIVDKDSNKETITADKALFVTAKPLVVLIDEASASASEIFSGAMKDLGRAELVGETTFGKGLVQMISELPDDSGINITVAKYLTPSGKDINKIGVAPDYSVEYDEAGFWDEDKPKKDKDLQLEKAIEVLKAQFN